MPVNSDEEVLGDELERRNEEEDITQERNIVGTKRVGNFGKRSRSTRSTKGLKKRQYSPSIKGKKIAKRQKRVTFSPTVQTEVGESDSDSVQDSLRDLVAAAASKFTSGEGTFCLLYTSPSPRDRG